MPSPLQVTYLSPDALTDGVGASQVLAYVERLADRGVEVRLHTFEKRTPGPELVDRLARGGIEWIPAPFGSFGSAGGLRRIAVAARAARGAPIVHARSDLSAASALLARSPRWLWDCRALFADQRIEMGTLRPGSPEHRALRRIERAAARRSSAIVTITRAAVPILEARHGPGVVPKATVITTCVDTARFVPSPPPSELRLLLAGTINALYDVPAMARLVEALRRRRPMALVLATPGPTAWETALAELGPERLSATPDEMPGVVAASSAGLSVWRDDAGQSQAGAMPTKIAEFLASGRPVVVNRMLGDAAALVTEHRAGVVLDGSSDDGPERAAEELLALVDDPATADRCRRLALDWFDLDAAVDRLLEIYRRLASNATS